MCTTWHPKDDLIASASLDQSVRQVPLHIVLTTGCGIFPDCEKNILLRRTRSPRSKNRYSNVVCNTIILKPAIYLEIRTQPSNMSSKGMIEESTGCLSIPPFLYLYLLVMTASSKSGECRKPKPGKSIPVEVISTMLPLPCS